MVEMTFEKQRDNEKKIDLCGNECRVLRRYLKAGFNNDLPIILHNLLIFNRNPYFLRSCRETSETD
jgi:hypothetical protein